MPGKLSVTNSISISAIESLKRYFSEGGVSIVQAAFAHTYFVHPERVRKKTPCETGLSFAGIEAFLDEHRLGNQR